MRDNCSPPQAKALRIEGGRPCSSTAQKRQKYWGFMWSCLQKCMDLHSRLLVLVLQASDQGPPQAPLELLLFRRTTRGAARRARSDDRLDSPGSASDPLGAASLVGSIQKRRFTFGQPSKTIQRKADLVLRSKHFLVKVKA